MSDLIWGLQTTTCLHEVSRHDAGEEIKGACCYVLELRGVCGVCGEAGSGLRGLDRLSWEETPWNRDRVSRRSPNCKLLGLCCFSGGVWNKNRKTNT